jgi:hypothetical protein
MNLPKQATPVTRSLPSVSSYSGQFGINPSMGLVDGLRQLFNRSDRSNNSPGTCVCRDGTGTPDSGVEVNPDFSRSRCNSGFVPQCDMNGGCACVRSGQQRSFGRVIRPFVDSDFERLGSNRLEIRPVRTLERPRLFG